MNFFILSLVYSLKTVKIPEGTEKRKYEFIAKDPQMIVSLLEIFFREHIEAWGGKLEFLKKLLFFMKI